jgi:hypothetical protein
MSRGSIMFSTPMVLAILSGRKSQTRRIAKLDADGKVGACPFGSVGDRLWMREGIVKDSRTGIAVFAADRTTVNMGPWRWKRSKLPAIFMPLSVARIQLEITEIRIHLLKSISREDAIAEGAFYTEHNWPPSGVAPSWSMVPTTSHEQCHATPRHAFGNYWNRIHAGDNWNLKPGPCPWELNPSVWALTFRRMQ